MSRARASGVTDIRRWVTPPGLRDRAAIRADGERWDMKTREHIARAVDAYIADYAAMQLEFPTRVILFAEDYDCLDLPGRRQVEVRHDIKILRGPSRREYAS